MSSTVWAVSKGSYSDYRVLCVCDSKKRAEGAVALYSSTPYYESAFIEEITYLDHEPKRVRTYSQSVEIYDDGRTTEPTYRVREEWEFDLLYPSDRKPVTWRWVRAPMYNGKGGRLDVSGTSRRRVAQVLSDKRAEILAVDALRLRREVRS